MTTKKRVSKPVLQPQSAAAAETAFADYAKADARIEEIKAAMDQKITAIREEHADELQKLEEICKEKEGALQLWAEANPDAFTKKKSIEMAHGLIGFRTGTPKLKPLKGFTWASVVNLLKMKAPDYVRTVDEAAKDKILADRAKPVIADLMNKEGVGLEVVQDEAFFIELKKEATAAA